EKRFRVGKKKAADRNQTHNKRHPPTTPIFAGGKDLIFSFLQGLHWIDARGASRGNPCRKDAGHDPDSDPCRNQLWIEDKLVHALRRAGSWLGDGAHMGGDGGCNKDSSACS